MLIFKLPNTNALSINGVCILYMLAHFEKKAKSLSYYVCIFFITSLSIHIMWDILTSKIFQLCASHFGKFTNSLKTWKNLPLFGRNVSQFWYEVEFATMVINARSLFWLIKGYYDSMLLHHCLTFYMHYSFTLIN